MLKEISFRIVRDDIDCRDFRILVDERMVDVYKRQDWLSDTFDLLQSGWLGIICVAILGPILEELLFRGAITKVLLKKYLSLIHI